MNIEAFSAYMRQRNCAEEEIAHSVSLIERFEAFSLDHLELSLRERTRAFVDLLVSERADSYDHLLALSRYGRFTGSSELFVEILSLLDGREVMENLHQKLVRSVPKSICDYVFAGVEMPSLGMDSHGKAKVMKIVMDRLSEALGEEAVAQFLSSSLRDLPHQCYLKRKRRYAELNDLQTYLDEDGREFVRELERIRDCHGLFFNQVITDEVVEYVRSQPEIASGVLLGDTLYITKIPYMAKEYLATDDPLMKRYYSCHCPWARESILTGETVSPSFCHCSAGFVKKQWEVIFGQSLKADVLESALKGDLRCRFAIHLPDGGPKQ
ncbi:MAG: hypothetical protein ACM3ZQ_08815 [Bacillota bacterium]